MALAVKQQESVREIVANLFTVFQETHKIADDSYSRMMDHADFFHRVENCTMVREGDHLSYFVMLLEGTVRYQKRSENGRQMTIFRVSGGEGCALSTACLLSGQPLPAEAVSESDLYGYAIPRKEFIAGLDSSHKFREFVFNGFGDQLGGVLNLASEIAFDPISVRLVKYLLGNADVRDIVHHGHQEIAEDLGTVREVISREIKAMKGKGWIEVGRGSIKLVEKVEMKKVMLKKNY